MQGAIPGMHDRYIQKRSGQVRHPPFQPDPTQNMWEALSGLATPPKSEVGFVEARAHFPFGNSSCPAYAMEYYSYWYVLSTCFKGTQPIGASLTSLTEVDRDWSRDCLKLLTRIALGIW